MMDDGKNKDSDEFDDTFDGDFSDSEFDETSYGDDAEYSEFSDDEGDYEGDDFESEEWGDEEEPAADKKKPKKQKKSGGGLSFNTIVIIGAVAVGAVVMVVNVMKETGKQKAAQPSMFQSILNISGVMDGTLFGGGDKPEADEQGKENQAADTGFLNNPSAVTQDNTAPPQPVPLAPAEQDAAQPLTPMPDVAAPPRGPDELPPTEYTLADDQTPSAASAVRPPPETPDTALPPTETAVADVPAPTASAEDILKQAMANREQKLQQDEAPSIVTEPAPVAEPAPEVAVPPVTSAPETPVAAPPVKEDVAVPQTTTAAPAVDAVLSADDRQSLADSQKAVAALETKLDTLLERMGKIEDDLGTLRSGSASPQTEELEEAVAALRKDMADIKARPAAPAPRREPAPKKADPAPVQKSSPSASTPSAPKPAPQARQQQGRWELRAAQPGRAWVSKAGERDMQAVSVGDTLAGIGRISAITYQNGRWSIIGTQGAIQQ